MSKYMDMLNEHWDKYLNLATYTFNISPSCDNSSSPYVEELHHYSGSNCGLK